MANAEECWLRSKCRRQVYGLQKSSVQLQLSHLSARLPSYVLAFLIACCESLHLGVVDGLVSSIKMEGTSSSQDLAA